VGSHKASYGWSIASFIFAVDSGIVSLSLICLSLVLASLLVGYSLVLYIFLFWSYSCSVVSSVRVSSCPSNLINFLGNCCLELPYSLEKFDHRSAGHMLDSRSAFDMDGTSGLK
jgi:hypothetical protein